MPEIVVWAIRPRANSSAPFEIRPHVQQSDGTWRDVATVVLATSAASALALLPVGSLLLFVSEDAEWWAPWYAPSWWWPSGTKPASIWDAPPVRAPALTAW